MPMRTHFNEALEELNRDVVKMSITVEEAIDRALTCFKTRDTEMARVIISDDDKINTMQLEIEDRCTVLIATEQPVASDLRSIITVIKLASNLERIGDHAVHLAQTTIRQAKYKYIEKVVGLIPQMGQIGVSMIRDAVDAFVTHNPDKARQTAERDRKIDNLHMELFQALITHMQDNPDSIPQGADFLFINRFMERLGDHVTNMCEWIIFSNTGNHVDLNR